MKNHVHAVDKSDNPIDGHRHALKETVHPVRCNGLMVHCSTSRKREVHRAPDPSISGACRQEGDWWPSRL